MTRYVLRRLAAAIPTLLAVSVILFLLLHLAPGGPMAVYATNPLADPAELEAIERRLGLKDPLPIQYGRWLVGMVSGDWGLSYKYARQVSSIIGERIGASLQLMGASLLIALLVSVPFGLVSALSRRQSVQHAASVISMLGVSIPTFWLGMMLLLFFSVRLRMLPTGGIATIGEDFDVVDRLRHLIGPALVLATLEIAAWSRYVRSSALEVAGQDYIRTARAKGLAGWSRYVRSSVLEVAGQDYIRTARAKGLAERVVVYRHVLRNALLPLITLVGLQGGRLVGGALITEVVFAWPGMGRLLTESLAARDYPVVMATFIIMSVTVIVGNLLADIGYALADPRIRLT